MIGRETCFDLGTAGGDIIILLLISIRFETSGAGFRLRTVESTGRSRNPISAIHCTEPESGTGRFEANGNRQYLQPMVTIQ